MKKSPGKRAETKSDQPMADQIKNEAWEISSILLEAQECLKVLEYLLHNDPATDVYLKHTDPFWRFTASLYADHVLLKLNILFASKEHYGIPNFLKRMKTDGDLAGNIPEEKIDFWEKEIQDLRVICKKISIRRNKKIAHRERGYSNRKSNDIKLTELKTIVSVVQNIVKEIYSITVQSAFQIEDPIGSPLESLKAIILTLNEEKRRTLASLFEEGRRFGLQNELPKSERH